MDKKLVKSIGEHWVCSELARRGRATALTRDGLARTDVLAVSTELPGRPMIEVQVKSATPRTADHWANWPIGKIVGSVDESGREWFVLAVLTHGFAPLYGYVVPRDHLTAATYLQHQNWLTDPGAKKARTAQVSMARLGEEALVGYRDRWDLFERTTSECQDLLPAELTALIDDPRVGLPDGHPWLEGKRPATR